MNTKLKLFQKITSIISGLSLVAQSLSPGLSVLSQQVYAQKVTPTEATTPAPSETAAPTPTVEPSGATGVQEATGATGATEDTAGVTGASGTSGDIGPSGDGEYIRSNWDERSGYNRHTNRISNSS